MRSDFDNLSTDELVALITSNARPASDPLSRVVGTVGIGSLLFHWAEAGKNPQITTLADSIHYIATSLSVGYSNIFPTTPAGKLVGAWIMIVGPALAAKALDAPEGGAASANDPVVLEKLDAVIGALGANAGRDRATPPDSALLEKLDAILLELKRLNG